MSQTFSLEEAAQQLGLSPKTVWNLVYRSQMRASAGPQPPTPKTARFSQEDIDKRKVQKVENKTRSMIGNRLTSRDVTRPYRD